MPIANKDLDKLPDSDVNCLRCDVRMKDAGEGRFFQLEVLRLVGQEGTELFQMRVCPKCGQVELFV